MGNTRRIGSPSFRQNWFIYLIVIGIFSLGILLGSLGVNTLHQEQAQELHRYLQTFLSQAAELDVDRAQMARGALYDNLLMGVIIYVLGLTIICLPLVLAIIFIKGFVLGFTISFLATDPELQGFLVILISMLPQNIFFIPALIIAGTASLSFSFLLIKRFFNSQTRVWPDFVGYTLIMTGCILAFAIAALAEGYITPELTKLSAALLAGW